MELIYKNEYGNAYYEAKSKLVKTQYIGLVKVDAITDLLTRVMEFSGKEKIHFMLANLSDMQGTFSGALDFFENQFYPTMIKNGLRSYACSLSKDTFTKFSASQLQKKVGGKLDWQAFSTLPDAEKWITLQIKNHLLEPPYASAS